MKYEDDFENVYDLIEHAIDLAFFKGNMQLKFYDYLKYRKTTKAEADSSTISFLGEIPLEIQIRESSDAGNPIVSQNPDSPIAKIYLDISDKIIGILSNINNLSVPPLIREE